jgi:hypothetical protein
METTKPKIGEVIEDSETEFHIGDFVYTGEVRKKLMGANYGLTHEALALNKLHGVKGEHILTELYRSALCDGLEKLKHGGVCNSEPKTPLSIYLPNMQSDLMKRYYYPTFNWQDILDIYSTGSDSFHIVETYRAVYESMKSKINTDEMCSDICDNMICPKDGMSGNGYGMWNLSSLMTYKGNVPDSNGYVIMYYLINGKKKFIPYMCGRELEYMEDFDKRKDDNLFNIDKLLIFLNEYCVEFYEHVPDRFLEILNVIKKQWNSEATRLLLHFNNEALVYCYNQLMKMRHILKRIRNY